MCFVWTIKIIVLSISIHSLKYQTLVSSDKFWKCTNKWIVKIPKLKGNALIAEKRNVKFKILIGNKCKPMH